MSGFIYLGTSDFAVTVLAGLKARGLRPALVVTPPDRPRGRGRRTGEAPVAAAAAADDLAILKTADVNAAEALAAIRASGAETAMVCAFGQIIREPLLSELTMLNVHPSLLPRWRGAAPIERAIMAGDRETGVCIIELEAGLDSGPIVASRVEPIRRDDDYGSLSRRLAELGGELAASALQAAAAGELKPVAQAEEGVTYAEKIERHERRLDPSLPASRLALTVRALTPHIGAYLELEPAPGQQRGERLGVLAASALPAAERPGQTGELLIEGESLLLVCADGSLRLERVKPAGGREMAAADYLRGHRRPGRALVGRPESG